MVAVGVPDYRRLEFPNPPPDRPYVLVNMVMSVDGKVVLVDTEQGLGSKTDQKLMRQLRTNVDVVLNGAGTLRASGTSSRLGDPELEAIRLEKGKKPNPIAAVISASGDLPLDRLFFTARDFDAIVYLASGAADERRKAIEGTGRPVHVLTEGDEVDAMLRHMRHELGATVLLVEGGPDLNSRMFAADCVDEFFLTVGALIVGGEDRKTAVEGEAFPPAEVKRLEMLAAMRNPENNELYLRYRVKRDRG
jgi:2,5-diamino-6-(ribosylamino)-4(3H)-pyrimidinone 5'-phosphate reductase